MKRWSFFCACLLLITPCKAVTITVDDDGPADFASIQQAINSANNDDEIEVASGTYNEAINFLGKAVRLYSSAGPEVTIIDGTGHYHVVQCINGEGPDTILQGFTVTGGDGSGATLPDYWGGGMFNQNSSPTVTDCIFSGNSAEYGGGMFNDVFSHPAINNCTFSCNTAGANGGGMYNLYSSPTVTNCTFNGNSAAFGGGMHNKNNIFSTTTVINCTFSDNSAIDFGAGMCNHESSPTVANCLFSNNTGPNYGGGMYNSYNSNPAITNCTFYGNSSKYGGGIYVFGTSNPTITNSILWSNIATTSPQLYGGMTVTYSTIQGSWSGTGNIDADPNFVNATAGNLRLSCVSPCIDAGNNSAVPISITNDLNGWSRFIDDLCTEDSGSGTAPIVDMGAYEFLPADIDGSGAVNLIDYAFLAEHWEQISYADCQCPDTNCDGIVNLDDLFILTAEWLKDGNE